MLALLVCGTCVATADAATINVSSTAGLVAAVASANAASSATTIVLAPGTYQPGATLSFTNTHAATTVQGPAPTASVNGAQAKFTTSPATLGGATLFSIRAGVTVNVADVALAGIGTLGGSPAIDDLGTLGLVQVGIGGAVGPAVSVEPGAAASVVNSTIAAGQDIGIIDYGSLALSNATVYGNANGGVFNMGGALTLTNSIVAGNGQPASSDCAMPADSSDHSLDSDGSCRVGALGGRNPRLGSIGSWGGTTPSLIPATGSPAIGAGNGACPAVDQRGASRPASGCDLGAVQTDRVAPVLTTSSITAQSAGPAGKAVTYTPTWNDPGAPLLSSSCSPASGSTFPNGVTTVTCTARDAFGNTGTGTFTVTVLAGPLVTTSGNVTLPAADATGATATFTASATDGTDGTDPVTCTPQSGSRFPIGRTIVTCWATDSNAQVGTATLTVTVADTTPPAISVPADVVAAGAAGTQVTYQPVPSAIDNVDGTDPVACSPASGSAFPSGPTTVTCSATDRAGNSATRSFTVTIVPVTPDHVNVNVQGEVSPQLSISAGRVDFGAFLPAVAQTYSAQTVATVTSTDSTATLTATDTSSGPSAGHLVHGTYSLAQPVRIDASSASTLAAGTGFAPLAGPASPDTVLTYAGPVTNDPVTVGFQQSIGASEVLHNGVYAAVVLLQLSGTP